MISTSLNLARKYTTMSIIVLDTSEGNKPGLTFLFPKLRSAEAQFDLHSPLG